jgi:hypothetical protein
LAATKYWCQKNFGIGKITASTKYPRQQNVGIDNISASTKSRHQQNVGACEKASLYCFAPAESAAADFSQTYLMFSYFSQKVLIPPHVVAKRAVAGGHPAFMGGLSPALYRLIVAARHAENVTNIGVEKISAPAKISLIFAKL